MLEHLTEYLETCFSGPNLVPSALLLLVSAYWLLVILGGLDVEWIDVDVDLNADTDLASALSFGLIILKKLNIGRVPLMVWISAFALSFWVISMLWDDPAYHGDVWLAGQITLRNAALAILAAKILTQPLTRLFKDARVIGHRDLIGRVCTVTTSEVTNKFGQAQIQAGTAPLLLNVRTRDGTLSRGDEAEIVDFDPERTIYFVAKAKREVQ